MTNTHRALLRNKQAYEATKRDTLEQMRREKQHRLVFGLILASVAVFFSLILYGIKLWAYTND